jgi:hypothetical protein
VGLMGELQFAISTSFATSLHCRSGGAGIERVVARLPSKRRGTHGKQGTHE